MSAGSGIRHSEFNHSASEPVNFLQIWVFPKERNIKPNYDQKVFESADRQNKFQTVVSPDRASGGLWINQDAIFSLADTSSGNSLSYSLRFPGNGAYLFVLEGSVKVGGETLNRRDAIGISDASEFTIETLQDAQLLLIEVPMN